jgi:putative hemolysin
MAEIALISAKQSRLQALAEHGDKAAARALALSKEPTQLLSTIQIGITAIGVLNGIIGASVFSAPLTDFLLSVGVPVSIAQSAATGVVVFTVTYFTIVVGELVPKRLAQINAVGISRVIAPPLAALARISKPLVYLLSVSTDLLLRMFGVQQQDEDDLTEEDIQAVILEGTRRGLIEQQEQEILRNVFRLDDRQITSLMTPRSEIIYLDRRDSLDQWLSIVSQSDHSRFPICIGGFEQLLGVISAKNLLKLQQVADKEAGIKQAIKAPVYVPETLSGMKLLEQFRESAVQLVFVVDEYGEVLGIVTIQDLLEALTGAFTPKDPEDVWAKQRKDGSWLLDGLIPIPELKDRLGLKAVPEERRGRYHTLGGMMLWLMGKLPKAGEVVIWEDWQFEIVDVDGNRIDKVLATKQS